MESTCGCCSTKFEERSSGYKRTLIDRKFRGERTSDILLKNFSVNVTPGKAVFVCSECCQVIRSVGLKRTQLLEAEEKFRKVRQSDSYIGKKIPTTPTHRSAAKKQKGISSARRPPNASPKYTTAKKTAVTDECQSQGSPSGVTITLNPSSVKGKALIYISKSKYRLGIKSLLEGSQSARKDIIHIISDYVRKEMVATSKYWAKQNSTGLEAITRFSWENVITVAKKLCPVTFEVLSASLTKKSHHRQLTKRLKSKTVSLVPNIGILLCIIGFVLSRKCDSLQHIISLMMWLGGCKQKVYRGFNILGLCQSISTTRRRIDAIRQSFDVKVKEWRDKLTAEETAQKTDKDSDADGTLQNLEDIWEDEEIIEVSIGDSSSDPSTNEVSSTEEQSEVSSESDITEESEGVFSSSAESQSYVSSKQKSATCGKLYFDITFDNVNQKIGVRHHVRGKKNTMLNMVQAYATRDRITNNLSNRMPSVDEIRQIPIAELLPSNHDELQLKDELSVIVSRILTSHVPAFADLDCVWSIPHQYSKLSSMKSEIVPMGILDKDESTNAGMTSILEDYTKYVPEYKDNKPVPMIIFCDGLSCERIEGVQRARINGKDSWARLDMFEPAIQEWHRRLMFVQDTYDELFSFDSHREKGTLYNLKQVFDHKSVSKNIMECFDKAEELLEFATEGYTILYAMQLANMQNIKDTPTDYPEDLNERIYFRDRLSRSIVDSVYEAFNTCDVLSESGSVSKELDKCDYCICKVESGGKMIYCSYKLCERGQWFHLDCIGMSEDSIPDGDWFCGDTCAQQASAKKKSRTADRFSDLKNDYVRHLIWRGLNNIARHDAVKENDGVRMIRHWKCDMFEFFEKSHPKYLIFGVRLLANIAGATSDRMKHSLTWERTVNVKGGHRKNIPKDLHCEHLNMEYKHNSRDSGGQLTEATVNRHSQMLGIGKTINNLFELNVVSRRPYSRKASKVNRTEDIRRMIKLLQPLDLLSVKYGRSFKGFEQFKVVEGVRFPKKLRSKIAGHIEKMAILREMVNY